MSTLSESADTGALREPTPPSSTLRWLFLCVSVLLLALLLESGVLAVRVLSEMRTQELAATRALAERTRALSGLWLSLQSYDQAVQQFVAQTAADRDAEARRRLDQLTLAIAADFDRYPTARDSAEDALLNGMRGVFSQQRTLYIAILAAPPAERRRQAESLLAERLDPVQKQILDWSGKLQAWNGDRLQYADHALVTRFASLQGSLYRVLGIGFGSGLLLVLGGMAYIVRLDRQTRDRYVELAQSRHALQRLSARLVDAQETERRSISRELHDEVGQSLGALLVDVGRLKAAIQPDNNVAQEQLARIKATAEATAGSRAIEVRGGPLHGDALRAVGRPRRDRADPVVGGGLRVRAAAGLQPRALRCRARWILLEAVRAPAPERRFPACVAAGDRRARHSGRDVEPRLGSLGHTDRAHTDSVYRPDCGGGGAAQIPAGHTAPVSDVAVSAAQRAGAGRLGVRVRHVGLDVRTLRPGSAGQRGGGVCGVEALGRRTARAEVRVRALIEN